MVDRDPQPLEQNVQTGPPGARWFIVALWVFMAVVMVGWATGWGVKNPNTASAPAQHHSTMGAATSH